MWPTVNLIESFLSGRTHRIRIGDEQSDVAHITSGVVQGSCLGPDTLTLKLYAEAVKLFQYKNELVRYRRRLARAN